MTEVLDFQDLNRLIQQRIAVLRKQEGLSPAGAALRVEEEVSSITALYMDNLDVLVQREAHNVHTAEPAFHVYPATCTVCGEEIRKVPGGQESTWVHDASGAVAGPGAKEF